MSRGERRLPVIITLVVGLMLSIMPLPGVVEPFRPDWLALLLIFWAMQLPRSWSVGTAWIVGIVLDVAYGTLLGQHAVALCVIVFVTMRFHLLMRVFPLSQLTLTVFALIALYQFILFWINGTILWPFFYMFLSGIRFRSSSRA